MRPPTTYGFEPAEGGTRFRRQVEVPVEGKSRMLKDPSSGVSPGGGLARFVENMTNVLERRGQ